MIFGRVCDWCDGPIDPDARRDAETCSVQCRQNRHTFTSAVGVGPAGAGPARRLAYADPPYPGKSYRYYRDHPDYAGEVDHAELVASLVASFDAWALSTSAEALPYVLSLCPPDVRVAAWVRGHRVNKYAQTPHNAWEPVIYGGQIRRADPLDASGPTVVRVDAFVHGPGPRLSDPDRVTGAKPAAFCRWVFDLLAATAVDSLVDVYPGSGGVSRAWQIYTSAPA